MKNHKELIVACIIIVACSIRVMASSPGEIIRDSSLIVVGVLDVGQESATIEVQEVLKGQGASKEQLTLAVSHTPAFYDLVRYVGQWNGRDVVVLGARGAHNNIIITDLHPPVWPMDKNGNSLHIAGGSSSFVKDIFRYEKMSQSDSKVLVSGLLEGVRNQQTRVSTLEYIDVFVRDKLVDQKTYSEMMYAVMFIVLSDEVVDARPPVVQGLAKLSSRLPKSLAIEYFSQVAELECEKSGLARSEMVSILRVRNLISEKSYQEDRQRRRDGLPRRKEFEVSSLKKKGDILRHVDAETALTLLDSPVPAIREKAPDVLSRILHGENASVTNSNKELREKDYWKVEIRKNRASLLQRKKE